MTLKEKAPSVVPQRVRHRCEAGVRQMNRSRLPSPQENPHREILPAAPVTGHARALYALKQGGTAKQCFAPANQGRSFFILVPKPEKERTIMKLKNLVSKRYKEMPADCQIASHALMMRGG